MKQLITDSFEEHITVTERSLLQLENKIEQVCNIILDRLDQGNKVMIFGNGGSASDAQHIAAEFVGRFVKNRRSLPAIALTTDTSALTAIGNDYGFDRIYERQIEGLAATGDVLIGISTSGNSKNVINGLKLGKDLKCITIGLSGNGGGDMNAYCDVNLVVPSNVTARVQEIHILIAHIICAALDQKY